MGHNLYRSFFLLVLVVLFYNGDLISQENPTPPDEFLIGALLANTQDSQRWNTQYSNYDQVLDCGFNAVWQIAIKDEPRLNQDSNLTSLSLFRVVYAANDSGTGTDYANINAEWQNVDYISYFTQAKYRDWEAEGDDQLFTGHVKIKHDFGIEYTEGDTSGWRSGTNSSNVNKFLIKGPDYWQYPRYTFTNVSANPTIIHYKAVFRMKIDAPSDSTFDVCRIMVINTDSTGIDSLLGPGIVTLTTDTLKTEYRNFEIDYDYRNFFSDSPPNQNYPSMPGSIDNTLGYGYNLGSKVQFKVQWLGNRQLFVDKIEVYDRDIWEHYFIQRPDRMLDSIITYDQEFLTQSPAFYSKLKYYNTMDEPHSLDCYEPIRRLQDILEENNIGADLLTHWYPGWNGKRDGDPTWPYYEALMQPHQVMFWYAPFSLDQNGNERNRDFTLYFLRDNLQKAQDVDPDFYATLQTWGTKNGDTYEGYYTPPAAGINAETMLALAHGARGIFYELYYSYRTSAPYFVEALVDTMVADSFARGSNWYKVQEIASRLNGTLGETLMTLDYDASGEDNGFLRLYPYSTVGDMDDKTTGTSESSRYLELYVVVGEQTPINFHTGFFKKQVDNNYFLLTNVVTTMSKVAGIKVFPPDEASNYNNYRFRNIEPQYNFDSTFTDSMMIDLDFPAGEGYLFQVAPVIKYGGRLLYDELTGDGITLTDDMVIDNGAELSVYQDYYADGNIIIKNGSIINQEGGTIHFRNGKKLIIEGNASIHGTSQDKLTFDFIAPGGSNGITINSGGSLNMTYCLIKNAGTGIDAETNYNASSGTLNIQYVDFENCSNSCITIQGQAAGDQIPSLPPPVIKYCNMSLSDYGVWVSNLAQVLIRENHITNTDMGVFLSNVSAPQVIGNTIQTSTYQLPGIFLESSNGLVRSNVISGHTNGIQLGNSSPDLGGNIIEDNLNRGLYVGTGSLPDMQGRLASDPEHPNLWYAVSGYNKISNNGGWSPDDDGSEIFINNADIIMRSGCNEITDQRIPNANESNHLYNTKLLMNCSGSIVQPEVHAELNFWDEHPIYPLEERFGDCNIYFDPVTDPCPLPLGGGDRLLITSSSGEVVDTLYAEQRTVGILSPTETAYAAAEEKFLTADYQGAEAIYNGIINSEDSVNAKLFAYRRLFETGRLLRKDESYFSDLRDSYLSLAGAMNDSVRAKVFNHLSTLSLVAREDYIPAIGEFDEIIQQNPNTEAAVYAEIDAVTASLLLEGGDTTLSKSRLGKYLAKPGSNYFTRMDEIIRKNFGSGMEAESEKLIPTEYSLYNNYPNPFNPTTTIRFDIPERTNVELVVYDILGRRVKSLISDEVRNPGRYEISFNGSSLASGVYIYKITTKNYSQARKMLLIK